MTAMDDLLNSSSLVMYPASIVATWDELEPGYQNVATVTAAESLIQLGQQIGPQGMTVTQSFDDGLPDPVTLTGTNDAAGSLTMDLTGRPPAVAANSTLGGNANTTNGQGNSTSFTATYPSGLSFWDYTFITIAADDQPIVTETSMAADSPFAWRLLGESIDNSGGSLQKLWVFGRKHYTSGVVAPAFRFDEQVHWAWVMNSIKCGRTASLGVLVPVTPGDVEPFTEGGTAVTTHTMPDVQMAGRGWTIGAFTARSTSGAWTASGTNTLFGSLLGSTMSVANIISAFRSFPGSYGMSGNTANSTNLANGLHFAMEVRDRPKLDAVGYFSPLNKNSPIYGFERDTATFEASINNIAVDGNQTETTRIFSGQMTGIEVEGRTANTAAVSRTRLLLDDSHELPTVYGWREGLETDWLIGYLLAQGGQYIGTAPSVYTRWWAPLHGSLHPYVDGSSCYTESRDWLQGRAGSYRVSPQVIDGPFVTAMFAEQKNAHTSFIGGTSDQVWPTSVPGIVNPKMNDLITQQNSCVRFSFWIRGDPADQAPTCVDTGDPTDYYLFDAWINNNYLGNTYYNWARVVVNPNRNFSVQMGNLTQVLTGSDLPSDGQWHFISVIWDYHNGQAKFKRDGSLWTPTGYTDAASQVLPPSEAVINARGGNVTFRWRSHLPVAELMLEAGPELWAEGFTPFYPTPLAPSMNATYRPTRQPLAVIAEPTPVQGWPTLQALAESTVSWMRVNELDNVEFVPLEYFGETAQMTVDTLNVLDTDFNAGDIALVLDPSRTRNVVTVQYTETRVGSQRAPILEMNTSLAVPVGTTYVTFPLDVPTAETHGAAQWWYTTPEFQKLTAAQIAGTNPIQNENVMSVNTMPDGSGTVFTSSSFTARIYDWTSNSITVQFKNTYRTLYLANNGTQIPFLRALGYPIAGSEAYSTVRDEGSIAKRRERALNAQMDYIQDRNTAQMVASKLATLLARPRPSVTVTVQGDARRTPGRLCEIVDTTGTQADGTWRITSITHRYNGPMYVQDVTLAYVGVTANWDEGVWDDAVWGA